MCLVSSTCFGLMTKHREFSIGKIGRNSTDLDWSWRGKEQTESCLCVDSSLHSIKSRETTVFVMKNIKLWAVTWILVQNWAYWQRAQQTDCRLSCWPLWGTLTQLGKQSRYLSYHLHAGLDQLSDSPACPFLGYLVLLRTPEHLWDLHDCWNVSIALYSEFLFWWT